MPRPFPIPALSVSHLVFLTVVAAWLAAFYPDGAGLVLALWLAGMVAEALPAGWRRWFVPEALLLVVGLAAWASRSTLSNEALHALVGIGMAAWLLVPARPGFLRWVLSLAIVELLFLAARLPELAGRAAVTLVPLALSALAVDAWLLSVIGARRSWRNRWWALGVLPWAVAPALLAAVLGLLASGPLGALPGGPVGPDRQPRRSKGLEVRMLGAAGTGLAANMDLSDQELSRDPTVAARLWLPAPLSGAPPMVYLRAVALSTLSVQGSHVLWDVGPGALFPALRPLRSDKPAMLLRMPGGADVILRPDGGGGLGLSGLMADTEDNLYVAGLGDVQRVYKVDPPGSEVGAEVLPADRTRCLEVPEELTIFPWSEIELPLWAKLNGEAAAAEITTALAQRCRYGIDGLPAAAPGFGGSLRTFLFGAEDDRRGHCQFFATSAAVLLRRAGHPARCVVGYASEEYDDQGATFRGLHAHAWVEVAASDGRWHRTDPTPGSAIAEVRRGLDLNTADATTQALDPETLAALAGDDSPTAATQLWLSRHAGTIAWGVALVGVGGPLLWWVRRRLRPAAARQREELEQRSENLLRLARLAGLPITPATTLSQAADTLSQRTGLDLSVCLAAHLSARFGSGPLPPPWPLADLRSRLKNPQPRRRTDAATRATR